MASRATKTSHLGWLTLSFGVYLVTFIEFLYQVFVVL